MQLGLTGSVFQFGEATSELPAQWQVCDLEITLKKASREILTGYSNFRRHCLQGP